MELPNGYRGDGHLVVTVVETNMKRLFFTALLSLLGLAWPQAARAQFIGDVGLQTVTNNFAGNSCTGTPQTFIATNIGAISHQATAFFPSATPSASVVMEIDGQDSISTYKISNPQISFATTLVSGTDYVVQASGYYPKIIISVTCTIGGVFNLTYSGAQTAFSPLVGPPGGTVQQISGGITNMVQGIVAQSASGSAVDPIIDGGLELPVNANFLTTGIDNFQPGATGFLASGSVGTYIVDTVPTPTKSGEFAIAFEANLSDGTGTAVVGPFACVAGLPGACGGGSPQISMEFLANVSAGAQLKRSFINSTPSGQDQAVIVLYSSPATAIRQANIAGGSAAVSFSGATLANSSLIAAVRCNGVVPCTVSGVADTQGNTWNPVSFVTNNNNGFQSAGIVVWASSTLSTAAADTITFTLSSGTAAGTEAAELTGTAPSSITQLAISKQLDPTGRQIVAQDAQFPNQFVCSVTLSTNTTTQCQGAPTVINGVPVRAYVTDFQINTTAGGTTSTIQLKTGTGSNCGTGTANLSAITYADTVVSITSVIGMRTPLFAPLQSAVCVTQAGAAAGTSVVEVHGFFAP
jgi:hypothetical protein